MSVHMAHRVFKKHMFHCCVSVIILCIHIAVYFQNPCGWIHPLWLTLHNGGTDFIFLQNDYTGKKHTSIGATTVTVRINSYYWATRMYLVYCTRPMASTINMVRHNIGKAHSDLNSRVLLEHRMDNIEMFPLEKMALEGKLDKALTYDSLHAYEVTKCLLPMLWRSWWWRESGHHSRDGLWQYERASEMQVCNVLQSIHKAAGHGEGPNLPAFSGCILSTTAHSHLPHHVKAHFRAEADYPSSITFRNSLISGFYCIFPSLYCSLTLRFCSIFACLYCSLKLSFTVCVCTILLS